MLISLSDQQLVPMLAALRFALNGVLVVSLELSIIVTLQLMVETSSYNKHCSREHYLYIYCVFNFLPVTTVALFCCGDGMDL